VRLSKTERIYKKKLFRFLRITSKKKRREWMKAFCREQRRSYREAYQSLVVAVSVGVKIIRLMEAAIHEGLKLAAAKDGEPTEEKTNAE